MKVIEQDLAPNTSLSLPITIWQVIDDIEPIDKNLRFRLRFGLAFFILMVGWWIYDADAPIGFLVFFSLICLPSFWFYIFHYRHFNLKANTPLPIITFAKHFVKMYDNYGNMVIDNKSVDHQVSKIETWGVVHWLVVAIKGQKFRYFLFDNPTCHYYIEVDGERYKIPMDKLAFLIESLVLEIKNNPNHDAITLHENHYVDW
ncbi:hypothetical protein [Moraxella oblonga]|uniref:hypothetical protein n=1 Tax=Moraxella oblonga TaxID=200413 RepID=UPI0008343E9D|nr:hypothetical protein [Moraxella oblonga]